MSLATVSRVVLLGAIGLVSASRAFGQNATQPKDVPIAVQAGGQQSLTANSAPTLQQPHYSVDGLALGTRLSIGDQHYRTYQCRPSEQFDGFTWCTKENAGSEPRGHFDTSYSILRAADGAIVYINRFQAPAFWSPSEVDGDIQQYAKKVREQPEITQLQARPGLPRGTLATWGKVKLEPLDKESLDKLAGGKSIKRGLLIDYIGDFLRSAREGLPIYRITGGAGFVWVASFDDTGKGTLRFCAVDASSYLLEQQPPKVAAPKPESSETEQTSVLPPQENVSAPLAYADLNPDVLQRNQAIRDSLFENLQANATKYTFKYVVINLPPGTLPGINVTIPVSHIRYSDTVFFAFDRSSLEPSAQGAVSDFAKTLMKDKSYRSVIIVGHTDAVGTDQYNYALSKNRAATVAIALRAAGIHDKFLGIVPMGKDQPAATNSTPEGQALNRRVEFFISDIPEATKAAIEHIKYNPCYRNDNVSGANPPNCDGNHTVPILPPSGEGGPLGTLDLSRSAVPSDPHPVRPALPDEHLQRPSIRELQKEGALTNAK
jgi:outer membrane protein OmpA-like peptidoglycan-associated protein